MARFPELVRHGDGSGRLGVAPGTALRWLAEDPLPGLLLRIGKRGAAVGFAGGGSGEGLLGWLVPGETSALANALAPYPLDPHGPPPSGLEEFDPFLSSDYLPRMREVMATVLDSALRARAEEHGLALIRY